MYMLSWGHQGNSIYRKIVIMSGSNWNIIKIERFLEFVERSVNVSSH